MQPLVLAEVTRGDIVESVHMGSIAVANAQGDLLYYAGDPHIWMFTRSALKPFQAFPFVQAGGAEHFGFGMPELALMCASHSGEPHHVAVVQAMLSKAKCGEQDLQCGCHEPIARSSTKGRGTCEQPISQLHNNCSGKHAGFLAYCRQHGLDMRTYLDPAHPLQQAIRESVAQFSSIPAAALRIGIDGCSAPNYAMPLSRLAWAYARFAQATSALNGDKPACILFDAMAAYPELVSGTGRSDLAISRAGNGDWVAKAGAEGVQAIGIRSAGLGIAIKISDGNARALSVVAIAVLQELGLLPSVTANALASLTQPLLRNCNGYVVGRISPAFTLQSSYERMH